MYDYNEPHKHMHSRYPDMIEAKEPIVLRIVAELGSNIANRDAGKGRMVLSLAKLDKESCYPVILSFHQQFGMSNAVRRSLSQTTRPTESRAFH
jgi:hypothetical protein